MSRPGAEQLAVEQLAVEELRRRFRKHLAENVGIAAIALGGSLAAGMVGYHWLAPMPWVDAFMNASMLLGGMGPVDRMETATGKMFAALYALFSGLVFIGIAGVIAAPWVHRMVHWVHLDDR